MFLCPTNNKYGNIGKKDKSSNKKSEKISKKNKATHSVFLLYLPLSTIITRGSLPLQSVVLWGDVRSRWLAICGNGYSAMRGTFYLVYLHYYIVCQRFVLVKKIS